jgi:hypothetical protein
MSREGWHSSVRERLDSLEGEDRIAFVHDLANENFHEYWHSVVLDLYTFQLDLNYLEVDLTNAFCPTGCCRMIDLPDGNYVLESLSPKCTVVLGLDWHEEETTWFLTNASEITELSILELGMKYGLRCGTENEDRWAKWKVERPSTEQKIDDKASGN